MTPEPPPGTTPPGIPRSPLRPPDIFLPKPDKTAEHRNGGTSGIYVSSGGQVYGPAVARDVVAGLRTGYFDADALFRVAGGSEWRPVAEMAQHLNLPRLDAELPHLELPPRIPLHVPPTEEIRPKWPSARRPSSSSPRGERRRSGSKGRSGKAAKGKLAGRLIVVGAILLAILITASLLWFISKS